MAPKKRHKKSYDLRGTKLSYEREKRRLMRKVNAYGAESKEARKQIERVKRLSAEMKVMKGI